MNGGVWERDISSILGLESGPVMWTCRIPVPGEALRSRATAFWVEMSWSAVRRARVARLVPQPRSVMRRGEWLGGMAERSRGNRVVERASESRDWRMLPSVL